MFQSKRMFFVTETTLVILQVLSYTQSIQQPHNDNDEKLDQLIGRCRSCRRPTKVLEVEGINYSFHSVNSSGPHCRLQLEYPEGHFQKMALLNKWVLGDTIISEFIQYVKEWSNLPRNQCPDSNGVKEVLCMTWAFPEPRNPMAFAQLPRTTEEATEQNCTELDNGCLNPLSHFTGIRYICNNSVDVILIYDMKGKVAGIQVAISKAVADNQTFMGYDRSPATQAETIFGDDYYVISAYFVDPDRICTGRSDSEFLEEGTVTNVYIQNGSHPIQDSKKTPILGDESTLNSMGWEKQICVSTMGLHYTYGTDEAKDCSNISPFVPMYDETSSSKRMTGFAFMMYGNYFSRRFEVSPKDGLSIFYETLPDCLLNAWDEFDYVTSLHVFFVENPRSIACSDPTL